MPGIESRGVVTSRGMTWTLLDKKKASHCPKFCLLILIGNHKKFWLSRLFKVVVDKQVGYSTSCRELSYSWWEAVCFGCNCKWSLPLLSMCVWMRLEALFSKGEEALTTYVTQIWAIKMLIPKWRVVTILQLPSCVHMVSFFIHI